MIPELQHAADSGAPASARVVIVGAGPHALTIAAHLLEIDPKALDGELVIVDPSGVWLGQWRRRMTTLEIPHLRSPVVHHPAPPPYELQDFARHARRSTELHGRYQLPGVELFDDFCDSVIDSSGLSGLVTSRAACMVGPAGCVHLDDGTTVAADHVVLTHGARASQLPAWAIGTDAVHADDVDLSTIEPGARVAIVGGGITAAHLAVAARARGAFAEIVCRKHLVEREFDSDPGWLGPKFMQEFRAIDDDHRRAGAVREARGGGSVPSWLLRELEPRSSKRAGVEVHVDDVVAFDDGRLHLASGRSIEADVVWCATGWRSDVSTDRLIGPLLECAGHTSVDGFAPLDHHLRIRSTSVHVTGPPASLVLGPSAGNLSGARRSARAIAAAVFGPEHAESLGDN